MIQKMTYTTVVNRTALLAALPIDSEALGAKTAASIILLQVAYERKLQELRACMAEVMTRIGASAADGRYQEALNVKLAEEVEISHVMLGPDELADIINAIGLSGDIMVGDVSVPRSEFVTAIAASFIEQP